MVQNSLIKGLISIVRISIIFMPNYMLDVLSMLGPLRWLSGKESPSKQETGVQLLGWEDPQKERATHPNILAWEIQWTEETDGLQSMGLQRVTHNLSTKTTK